ncbi:M20/M25/M40 family metallo-hydrolase [Rugosimonospora acidiphila]|uniref:M20/M25/M40 family metallo-hydrolase n=1 Tax=Rugosimonospora acidiphila TaxID=556531 RepID=A0ABP9S3X2_9ACTN
MELHGEQPSEAHKTSTRRAFLSAGTAAAVAATSAPLIAAPLIADPAYAGGSGKNGAAPGPGGPVHPQRPDRELRKLLSEVDRHRIEATVNRLVAFGTRHTSSTQTDPVRGIGAATTWVYNQLSAYAAASGGRMTVERQSFLQPVSPSIPVPTQMTNVIATLRGDVSPERIYVATAHLDSRVTDVLNFTDDAPGADDDGSGVAVLLELARLLATRHVKATIILGIVVGEEQGLYGSAFMAKQLKAAGAKIQGMFSNDIVGASSAFDGTPPDPHTLRLFVEGVPTSETPGQAATRQSVGGENDGPSRQLGRFVTSVADNDDTDMRIRVIWRRDRYLRGSDHVSFLQQGYPAARFTEPRENYNHEHNDVAVVDGVQHGDLPQFCDFAYMTRVAKVNATTLWSLAQAPGTPANARIVATTLTNLSTLTWTRGTEPDLAGYEVLWRETTADDWTNVISVGDVTTATIDLVKDNVCFGIRAVDTAGHRSPVASPQPS